MKVITQTKIQIRNMILFLLFTKIGSGINFDYIHMHSLSLVFSCTYFGQTELSLESLVRYYSNAIYSKTRMLCVNVHLFSIQISIGS